MKSNAGIYCMYFPSDDGKYYVGQSIDLSTRIKRHFSELNGNKHPNLKLQKEFNSYLTIEVEILEYVDSYGDLDTKEIYWIEKFEAFTKGFNKTLGGKSAGFGQYGGMSLYTNDTYIKIATEIANTKKSYKQIAEELNVSDRVVGSIGAGQSHLWLSEAIPEVYSILVSKIRNKDEDRKEFQRKIFLKLVNSDDRLIDIAKELNVPTSTLEKIAYGTSCKFLQKEFPIEYEILMSKKGTRRVKAARAEPYPLIVSPDGKIFKVENAREFARLHGLTQSNLSSLMLGNIESYKGWKVWNSHSH